LPEDFVLFQTIRTKFKVWFSMHLEGHGIDAAALFHGVDGIGRAMTERLEDRKRSMRIEADPNLNLGAERVWQGGMLSKWRRSM
jgi:hypothetical protein